ncbi:lipopolysaccharide biosynthesis protein [Microvirga arabica]|uniref:Lipopolysaccharide biosynthesis protein n=1 Tax=Microvirga arabica TaxID=1128671 RepID=A0ABV6YDF9_9HYPH
MTLHKQAATLTMMHAFEVLQPLLLLPYGARVLGPAAFGQYAYILALSQIANMIVDYGFSWTASRSAASARDNPAAIAKLFAEVAAAKIILCLGLGLVGLAVHESLSLTLPMLLCVMLTPMGATLFVWWLFIAVERPWQAAVPVILARSLAFVLFITMVESPSDVELAAAIQASIPLLSAVFSFPYIVPIAIEGSQLLKFGSVIRQFREGWPSFLSNLSSAAAAALPIPLVGYFAGFHAAGQFSVAEKLIAATRIVFRVMGETLMPRVAYLAHHAPARGVAFVANSFWTLIVGGSLSLGLYLLGPYIIPILFGPDFNDAIGLTNILYVLPFLSNVSFCASSLYMFNYGYERAWVMLAVLGLLIFLSTSYILSHWMEGGVAVALGVVAGESLVAILSTTFFVSTRLAAERCIDTAGARDM